MYRDTGLPYPMKVPRKSSRSYWWAAIDVKPRTLSATVSTLKTEETSRLSM